MAQVNIRLNGYAYTLACKDGEEQHLVAMVNQVELRVAKVRELGNQSGEARLLVMAALLMADELHDMALELKDAQAGKATPSDKAAQARLKRIAARAEGIAQGAEAAQSTHPSAQSTPAASGALPPAA